MQMAIERRELYLLLSVLAAALVLRLWGVGFGLPYQYANDEYHEVMRAMELGAGGFNIDRTGKGGLYFLLFLEYGFYFVALKVLGVVDSAMDFARHFARDPSAFYYMGRVTVAIFGALTVLVAYLVGRRAYTGAAGLLAGIFLTVNVLHADLSHRISIDITMTLLAGAALLMAVKLANDGSMRTYIWAAIFASLATTTKIPAILLIIPLLIAHTYHVGQTGGSVKSWIQSRALWISFAVFTLVLVGTNPGIVTGGVGYLQLFLDSAGAGDDFLDEDGLELLLERPNLYLFYLAAMRDSMGWPLFLLSSVGVAYGLWKRTHADVILISFAAALYLAVASTTSDFLYYPRYTLPILFVLAVLAGRVAYDIWQTWLRGSVPALAGLTAGLIALPAYDAATNSWLLTQTDTRTLAKEWMEDNVPHGARVFIEGAKLGPVRTTVPLRNTAEGLEQLIEHWRVEEPRQAIFLEFQLQVLERPGFNLELVAVDEIESLHSYRERGVEYFVIRPDRLLGYRRSTSNTVELLNDLRTAEDVVLVHGVEAAPRKRPGPTIEIYRLDANRSDTRF